MTKILWGFCFEFFYMKAVKAEIKILPRDAAGVLNVVQQIRLYFPQMEQWIKIQASHKHSLAL